MAADAEPRNPLAARAAKLAHKIARLIPQNHDPEAFFLDRDAAAHEARALARHFEHHGL